MHGTAIVTAVKATEEFITPEAALALLTTNTRNRPLSRRIVRRYAEAMARGDWVVNGEAIKISSDGALLDGQHRLEACVVADVAFRTLVMRGLPAGVFDTLDAGRNRTAADVLAIDRVPYATTVSASVRVLFRVRNGGKAVNLTARQVREFVAANEGLVQSASATVGAREHLNLGGWIAALHFLFTEKDPAKADRFFEDLSTGAGLSLHDPVLMLRNRLILAQGNAKAKMTDLEKIAVTIRAWNARRKGEVVRVLRGLTAKHDGTYELPEIE